MNTESNTLAALVEACMTDEKTLLRLAKSSRHGYTWYLRSFAAWMGPGACVCAVTDETRPDYLAYLEKEPEEGGRGYRPRLVRCCNQSLLFFYRWMVNHPDKYLIALPADRDKVKLPGLDKVTRRSARPEMALAMIEATGGADTTYHAALLRAIITMFHDIPLRKMELLNLELADVDLGSGDTCGDVNIRHGKGDKNRLNCLSEDGVLAVRAYVALRPKSALPYLWLHGETLRVGESWLYQQIRILADRAGIVDYRDVSPHACRRGTARRYRKAGMDLLQLMRALGHTSLAITQMYIESDDDELRENRNIARLFPDAPALPADARAELDLRDPPAPTPPPVPQPAPQGSRDDRPDLVQPPPPPISTPIAPPVPPDLLQKRRNNDWRNRSFDRG